MKKILLIMMFCLLIIPNVEAKPHRFHRPSKGHHVSNVVSGIVGITAGVLLAGKLVDHHQPKYQTSPRLYVVEPEGECYTVVSRKTGKITQQCVENNSDNIIYVD